MTLTAPIVSALVESIVASGGFSEELLTAVRACEGEEIDVGGFPLTVANPDYPTTLSARASIHGDEIRCEYTTGAGTPDERVHVAGRFYVCDVS